ncbi:MAG: hypothetical protein ACI8ZM_002858 [Crocinitomix sp.]|jgi:hypothetical protein
MVEMNFSCPENIGEMSPTIKGRFCDSCQKDIIDYTNMSNNEIREQLKTATNQTCGIFKKRQVMNSNRVEMGSRFRLAFMLVFMMGLSSTEVLAQDTLTTFYPTVETEIMMDSSFIIKGVIVDSDSIAIPFARVWVEVDTAAGIESSICTMSDIEGNYKINIPHVLTGPLSVAARTFSFEVVLVSGVEFQAGQNEIEVNVQFLVEAELHIIGVIYNPYPIPKNPYEIGKIRLDGEDIRQWD